MATAICEEFCERLAGSHLQRLSPRTRHAPPPRCVSYRDAAWDSSTKLSALKCGLCSEYFPELFNRLRQVGYCCTSVKTHSKFKKCVAIFEPSSPDE